MKEMAKEYPLFTMTLLSIPMILIFSHTLDAYVEHLGIGTTLFILYLSLIYIVAIFYLIKKVRYRMNLNSYSKKAIVPLRVEIIYLGKIIKKAPIKGAFFYQL
jgi:hypothetical protein